ncbi:MAG: SDR family oxidoreductase [Verrucomicrobiales bacterium]|nr:SDR family oxidoreductase [Verrucomicrobiales bacterium]
MTPDPTPIALITGGQGALARATAAALQAAGWRVDAPSHSELDVTSAPAVAAWFATHPQAYDLVIHSAGQIEDQLLLKMDPASFDRVLAVHLGGAFRIARAALPAMMQRQQGHLIWIGSLSAYTGPAGQAAYAAAKAGLEGWGKSLAREVGADGIRINGVLPGFLDTPMTASLLADADQRRRILAQHTLGRLNTVEDAARFIVFLHSLPHVSGQVFQLDSRIRG